EMPAHLASTVDGEEGHMTLTDFATEEYGP
ncbi:unnamed protein product, partial [marine sediment metagenome]